MQILSVSFNHADVDAFDQPLYASISVQLLGTDNDFMDKHSIAFNRWTGEHYYYFNPNTIQWQHERIYSAEQLKQGDDADLSWIDITFLGSILVLVLCLTVVSVYTFRWSRSQIAFHSSVVEMNRQILNELRDSKK